MRRLVLFYARATHQAIGIHSSCHLIPVQKLEFRSGLLEWAETGRIHFSGSAAGVGVTAHLQARAETTQGQVARSRNPLAKAAFSAGADAVGLGAHRTLERPERQTNLLPALAPAKPQTGQGHLAQVPRRMQMNASYLSALFSQTTSVTFYQFLEEVRLSKAKALLGDPRNRVGEVACAAG